MTEDSDEPWWQGEGGDLQGVPNALVSAPQQIFVSQGQGMSVPQSTSAMIIIALVIAILSLVCCQPLAIIPLIMGAVKMSETSNYQNHPDKSLAIVTVVLSLLALAFLLLQMVVGIAMEF
jgi:Na+/H+ antiporter NhaD/arsenite permease-like protein|tara:strand:+ start:930 stop:1289 length:360 start_codon:yes stop_codon:yes gene_type:complete